jgi:hypothetical protein
MYPPGSDPVKCVLECSVLLHHMTGLIPRPGVLLLVLSPPDSCVLSARLPGLVCWLSPRYSLHIKKNPGVLVPGSFEFVSYCYYA